MFVRLLLLFVLLPLADLVLIWMLLQVHASLTVLWILVSGLVGAWYVRRQGMQVLADIRASVEENRVPTNIIVEGAIVLFAGGLLITPGMLTDLFGFSMLIKPCRRWYRRRILAWLKKKVSVASVTVSGRTAGRDILDAEVVGRKSASTHAPPPGPTRDSAIESSEIPS
jgi:UPF0716 protein FxsA